MDQCSCTLKVTRDSHLTTIYHTDILERSSYVSHTTIFAPACCWFRQQQVFSLLFGLSCHDTKEWHLRASLTECKSFWKQTHSQMRKAEPGKEGFLTSRTGGQTGVIAAKKYWMLTSPNTFNMSLGLNKHYNALCCIHTNLCLLASLEKHIKGKW